VIAAGPPLVAVDDRRVDDPRRPGSRHETEVDVPRFAGVELMEVGGVAFIAVADAVKGVVSADQPKPVEFVDQALVVTARRSEAHERSAAVEVTEHDRRRVANNRRMGVQRADDVVGVVSCLRPDADCREANRPQHRRGDGGASAAGQQRPGAAPAGVSRAQRDAFAHLDRSAAHHAGDAAAALRIAFLKKHKVRL